MHANELSVTINYRCRDVFAVFSGNRYLTKQRTPCPSLRFHVFIPKTQTRGATACNRLVRPCGGGLRCLHAIPRTRTCGSAVCALTSTASARLRSSAQTNWRMSLGRVFRALGDCCLCSSRGTSRSTSGAHGACLSCTPLSVPRAPCRSTSF